MPTTQGAQSMTVSTSTSQQRVIKYVPHESYDDSETVREILESLPGTGPDFVGDSWLESQSIHDSDVAVYPIPTAEEEMALFRRMNCLRHLAQKRLNDELCSGEKQQRVADRLLDSAREVRNEIMLRNQRLVASIANRFRSTAVPVEDLIAEGNIVLTAAVNGFDCHRGFRFSTYATHSIRRHLSRVISKAQMRAQTEPSTEPRLIEATCSRELEAFDRPETANRLKELLTQIPHEDRVLIEMRFGLGNHQQPLTFAELGRVFGYSGESMRQRLARATDKMRSLFEQQAEALQSVRSPGL